MRVLHVIDTLACGSGGTARACAQLASHLVPLGVEQSILTFDGTRRGGSHPVSAGVTLVPSAPAWPHRAGYSAGLAGAVARLARPDLVHLHGLWRLSYAQAAGEARRFGVPCVISVNGMLHEPALGQRAMLKAVARRVFQDRVLNQARCLHATAPDEARAIRSAGFDRPVAVVPWGVDMPGDAAEPCGGLVSRPSADALNSVDGRRIVLYLGRLHESKGLETLVRAWAAVHARFAGWRLVLAGYDADGYGQRLMRLSTALALDGSIALAGPVEGIDRERLFATASLVVLPSPAENFGFVVPEALARGVPVIATHGAPWPTLADDRCGWWIAYGVEPLAAALADALATPSGELRAMGDRGCRFVRDRFAWPRLAGSMLDVYRWAVGDGPEPACLQSGSC